MGKKYNIDFEDIASKKDEEYYKKLFDNLVAEYGGAASKSRVDTRRVVDMEECTDKLFWFLKHSNQEFRLFKKSGDPFGTITILTKNLEIRNVKTFMSIVRMADTIECVSKTDGAAEINLTFRLVVKHR